MHQSKYFSENIYYSKHNWFLKFQRVQGKRRKGSREKKESQTNRKIKTIERGRG